MLLSASQPIWSLPLEQVYPALRTTPEGLSQPEAEGRLERYGANRLPPLKRRPLVLRFLDQMVHFMALLLWIAGVLAFVAGTPQLGWAIWAVVLINGIFSFWQEFQAERTLAALTRCLPRQVQVWRDGRLGFRSAEDLVAGDRLLLEGAALCIWPARWGRCWLTRRTRPLWRRRYGSGEHSSPLEGMKRVVGSTHRAESIRSTTFSCRS